MEVLQTNGVAAKEAAAAAEASPFTVDDGDLLNFSLDDGEDIDGFLKAPSYSSSIPLLGDLSRPPTYPEFMEEELEWLSNKDAFPSVETCFDLLPENPVLNQHSPVSVLENSNSSSCSASNGSGSTVMSCYGPRLQVPTGFPARARSKRLLKPRAGLAEFTQQLMMWKNANNVVQAAKKRRQFPGRKCHHCQTDQTPQWRAGPAGPKTLCNACGVRYKSGRLVPEYRPANSPTYSAAKHSNSHRKIVEMRRQKYMGNGNGGELMMVETRTDNGEQGLWWI